MEIDVEKLQEQVKKMAKKAGKGEDEVEKLYAKFSKDFAARGVAEDDIEGRTLMRILTYLKRPLIGRTSVRTSPGFIMSRSKAYDGSKKARAEANYYVKQNGVDAAVKNGYMNADGDLLYRDFDWRKGEPIPDEDWKATGLAMLEIKGSVKIATVNYKGEGAIKPLKLFKINDAVPVFVRNNSGDIADVTISKLPDLDTYSASYVDFHKYADKVVKGYPDRILNNLMELEDFYAEYGQEFGSWCIVEGNVIRIATTKKTQSTAVEIEDQSLSLIDDEDEIPTMTVFFPKEMPVDFKEDAQGVTFIVSPYMNNDGELILSGLGYWADPIDRVDKEAVKETPDPTAETWG